MSSIPHHQSIEGMIRHTLSTVKLMLEADDHKNSHSFMTQADIDDRTHIMITVKVKPTPPLDRIVEALEDQSDSLQNGQ
jgi:uncharacterized protein YqgV (UPF0045/DUF77 family)